MAKSTCVTLPTPAPRNVNTTRQSKTTATDGGVDIHWACAGVGQPISRLYVVAQGFPVCTCLQMAVGIYTDQVLESYKGKNRLEVWSNDTEDLLV